MPLRVRRLKNQILKQVSLFEAETRAAIHRSFEIVAGMTYIPAASTVNGHGPDT